MSDPQVQPPAGPPAGPSASPTGFTGMVSDASTLASTGLVAAVLFSTVAGLIGAFSDPGTAGVRGRLLNLTDTVDVGDVAILGIAVALLLLTPDPPDGGRRPVGRDRRVTCVRLRGHCRRVDSGSDNLIL